jgi:hypothetical protein
MKDILKVIILSNLSAVDFQHFMLQIHPLFLSHAQYKLYLQTATDLPAFLM